MRGATLHITLPLCAIGASSYFGHEEGTFPYPYTSSLSSLGLLTHTWQQKPIGKLKGKPSVEPDKQVLQPSVLLYSFFLLSLCSTHRWDWVCEVFHFEEWEGTRYVLADCL